MPHQKNEKLFEARGPWIDCINGCLMLSYTYRALAEFGGQNCNACKLNSDSHSLACFRAEVANIFGSSRKPPWSGS